MRDPNTRLGLVFFFVYTALYLGFMLINTFAPAWMEWTPVAGLNLAILYGFGLIVIAFVLALLYGLLCKTEPAGDGEGKR